MPLPLAIVAQPQGASLYVDASYALRVVCEGGAGPLTHEWAINGTPIPNSDSSQYRLQNITHADAGSYQCFVSDGVTELATNPVPLAVFDQPLEGNHTGDTSQDWLFSLSELLRVIQFFNSGALHCQTGTEDGYAPGGGDTASCSPHSSDYGSPDWSISLSELLRAIQFFNSPGSGYHAEPGSEDGFAPQAG